MTDKINSGAPIACQKDVFPTLQSLTQCPARLHLKQRLTPASYSGRSGNKKIENDEKITKLTRAGGWGYNFNVSKESENERTKSH